MLTTDQRRSAPFTIAGMGVHDRAKQPFTISEMRIHPLHHRFTPPLDTASNARFVGSESLSGANHDAHQAPRAPLPS
jgi:hypothetical protein